MRRVNRKTIFIRRKEGAEKMTKAQIEKGLRSRKIKDKEKALRDLTVQIINDPYFDQMLMTGQKLYNFFIKIWHFLLNIIIFTFSNLF